MRITKRQLRRIIGERLDRTLNEYGGSAGVVSWYEDDENDVLFDIEGRGEGLTRSQAYDVLNDLDTDDSLVTDIQAAIEDYEDYMYSS